MNQPSTITRRATIVVLVMSALAVLLLVSLACQAVEAPQAHLRFPFASRSKSLTGPIYQYIDDPLVPKADRPNHDAQTTVIAQ
jgi:hypothetical protein